MTNVSGNDDERPPLNTGYFVQLPISLVAGFTVVSLDFMLLPGGTPNYCGARGLDDQGRPALCIGLEWPTQWLRMERRLSQQQCEELHVQRFRTDLLLLTGEAYWNARPGTDPPDMLLDCEAGTIAIECTRLAIGRRQNGHGLFRQIRKAVASRDSWHFRRLAGTIIYVWFGDETTGAQTLPFARHDDNASQLLLEGLSEYEPDVEALRVTAEGVPEQAPELPLHKTPQGGAFYAAPFLGSAPDTAFFNFQGFEMGMAYTTMHVAETEWADLWKRVAKKDEPNTNLLLISAGAPDEHGYVYPAEEALLSLMLEHPTPAPEPPQHLQQVWVHSWSTGTITQLWPDLGMTLGPLYQGLVPAHRPFPTPTSAADGDHH